MPGKRGGNEKDFTRPAKDMGHKWNFMHDDAKEKKEQGYESYLGYVKEPKAGAGNRAKKGGAVKGSGASKPRSGPWQKPKAGTVKGRKG